MSDSIEDGGCAFPSPQCGDWSPEYGMSLRDWFAGQALAGLCGNGAWSGSFTPPLQTITAEAAYSLADAMIAARKAGA